MAMPPIVSIQNLNYFYGKGDLKSQVLYDINLEIKPGEFVILTGPSGSGKSTLLSLIGCLRPVNHGSLKILGKELKEATPNQLTLVRRNFGYITQASNLIEFLNAWQNVQMSLSVQSKLSAQKQYQRSVEILTAIGLGDRINHYPSDLSGGQRQRVALASALVNQPQLVLADEPTAALDKKSGRNVVALMQRLAKQRGSAILMVTHDSRILDFADRIISVEDGRLGRDLDQEISIALPEFDEALLKTTETQPTVLSYSSGEVIIQQGEPAHNFYILLEGIVEVFQENVNQSPKLLARMKRGEYFGEIGLLQGGKRTATVRAAKDSEVKVVAISQPLFQAIMDHSGLTSSNIVRQLHRRTMSSYLARAFPNIKPGYLENVATQINVLRYGANSYVVQSGEQAQCLYLILNGQVEILTQDSQGQEFYSHSLSSGDCFGDKELITKQPYSKSVRVLSDSELEVMTLSGSIFLDLVSKVESDANTVLQKLVTLIQK